MEQVSVSSVNLEDPESSLPCAMRRRGEARDDVIDSVDKERLRQRVVIRETKSARSNDILPSSGTLGDHSLSVRRAVRARLAASMRQLHSGDAALLMDEADDPRQWLDVIVHPDTKILRT